MGASRQAGDSRAATLMIIGIVLGSHRGALA